jgi:two-component system response regulator AtoC
VPPLRQRKEDIPVLLEYFLKLHAGMLGLSPAALQPNTLQALIEHSWPGNVRELEEVAKKILLSDEGAALAGLRAARSPSPARGTSAVLSLKEAARNASRQVERELILKTLARTRWNRKRAARELGISYKALLYKLKQIAFDDPTGI